VFASLVAVAGDGLEHDHRIGHTGQRCEQVGLLPFLFVVAVVDAAAVLRQQHRPDPACGLLAELVSPLLGLTL
jgi:hypothetical protein